MTTSISTAFVQQYKDNIALLLQQMGSKLRDYVDVGTGYEGIGAKVVEQVGKAVATEIIGRDSDTPLSDVPQDARWVYPRDYAVANIIDTKDKLRMIVDPTSKFAQAQVYALGREMDRQILRGYFGANATGQTGATSTAFTAGNKVAVNFNASANVGLTFAKLLEARSLLGAGEVDFDREEVVCLLTMRDHNRLLSEVEVASREFNETPVYEKGMIHQFLGIQFKTLEMLAEAEFLDASGYRQLPVYLKSRVHLALWEDLTAKISERDDKNYATQVYTRMTCGATRLEEAGCTLILATGS